MERLSEIITAKIGYAADPAIDMLLPKDLLSQIKIRQIEGAIRELESVMDVLNMQREMLQKHYGK